MNTAHAHRAHALLSASGSSRWLACTPSARLEESLEESNSDFADEGTAAHELAELHLALYLGLITKRVFTIRWKQMQAGKYYSQEMEDHIRAYVDIVIERMNEAKARTPDAVVQIEQRLDFSLWVPDGFGTGDVLIIADGMMEVIDLKYGKGVAVSAEGNTQMKLYGLGALYGFGHLYDIDSIRMTIVQPRLDSISSDEISAEALIDWAENVVKPRAALAMAGEGEFVSGSHCRFCRARFSCRARADANLEMARFEFADPPLLSIEEIGEILFRAIALKAWVTDIEKYAFEQAEKHGVKVPGWKLVEGRSNRTYSDKQAVSDTLLIEGYAKELIYEPASVLGITAMEKVLGKNIFAALLNDFIVKPAGKPTLVSETDPRPELSSAASAVSDFSE